MSRVRSLRLVGALALSVALAVTEWHSRAVGTISGVAFEDFNGNGLRDTTTTVANAGGGTLSAAIDHGVAGIVVTAYDLAGVVRGSATTAADGSYSVSATGTGPYRIEFTSLPSGYRSSAFGAGPTGNGTTVQFVPDGTTGNVNLGVLNAADYCQNNPTLVTSCFVFGGEIPTGPYPTEPVVVDFPYSAGANTPTAADYEDPTTHALMAQEQAVGSVYGLGYRPQTNRIYAAAFMKKHTRFGPDGPGAIYIINPASASGTPVLFADLDAIFGPGTAGGDAHAGNGGDYDRDNGNAGWDAVGKTSLGGLEVSPDGAFVFAVNLGNRRVYRLPTSGALTSLTVSSVSIPLNAPGATGAGADLRPFALQYHKGLLYVGIINSAETTGATTANLRAYIYTLDPATLTFSASPVLQFPLNYPRGAIQTFDGTGPGAWNRWSPVYANGSPSPTATYPQPMLTGLAFDVDGNLSIGIRDRAGDQFGYFTHDNPANSTRYEGVAGGDTLFAAINTAGDPSSGWTLEANAAAGGFGPTGGAGNNQGPGTGPFGEYYFQDNYGGTHTELSGGALLHLPGFPDVISSAFDPGLTVRTGGFIWLSQTAGTRTKGYELYNTGFGGPPLPTFSKVNGFGEVVPTCQAAPIEIGNRVWRDGDGDGVQDPGEAGIDNVTVQLIAPGGTLLASVLTTNGGRYYFSSTTIPGLLPDTSGYILRIAPQAALSGLAPTWANADGTANGDSRDSDGVSVGVNAEVPVATGAPGDNVHTYDFGFAPPVLSLGNYVWYDTDDDGTVDVGEVPIDGVDVALYRDSGDGTFNVATDTLVAAHTTAGGGAYLFTGLSPGSYFVQIPAAEFSAGQTLSGSLNSSGQTSGDTNNVDHGAPSPVPGQGIVSDLVSLTNGGEPTNDGDTDANSNLTIDFGFFRLTLGNLVFDDNDNSGTFNAGDVPRDGVTVQLLDATGSTVLNSTTTAGGGLYGFPGLTPGAYVVQIIPPPGLGSSTGGGSEPAPGPDGNIDSDDNGTLAGAVIMSGTVTLTPGSEPVVTNSTGTTSNPTVDFGLIPLANLSLGNLVWRDDNNDGVVTAGEPGLDGVTVRLLNATGTVVLGTQVTTGGGFYLFMSLQPGDYMVEVVTPAGLTSSSGGGTEPAPDPDNDVDNDDNGTTNATVVRSTPVTLAFGAEPVTDGDTSANSNLSVDFGFVRDAGPGGEADVCLVQQIPATVAPGGQMTAVYAATNRGPGAAFNLIIDGMLPPGVSVVSTAPSPGGTCTSSADMLDCRWPGATPVGAPGGVRSVSVDFRVAPTMAPGTPIMLWFMTSASNSDPYPACNMVDGYVFVSGGPTTPVDLRVDATATSPWETGTSIAAPLGEPVTARFSVTNAGSAPARGHYALLLDEAGVVDVVSTTASQGASERWNPTSASWETGLIPAGGSATFTLSLLPRDGTGAHLQLLRFDGAPADPNAANDRAELMIDAIGPASGRSVAAGNLDAVPGDEIVTGAGLGETPQVRIFSGTGTSLSTFAVFERAFRGGVRVASCDVDGNGVDELVVAQGPGGGRVRVLSIADGAASDVVSFDAFEPDFMGGVNVACGDVDGNGRDDVVVGPEGGRAPDVKVFAVGPLSAVVAAQFRAYEAAFTGGVRVAAHRWAGSGLVGPFSVMTTPGPGRPIELAAWAIASGGGTKVAAAVLFESTGGARLLLDDVTGDAIPELAVMPEAGASALLQIYSLDTGATLLNVPSDPGGYQSLALAAGFFDATRELVVARGAGEPPTVGTFVLGTVGVSPRLSFTALEVP